MRNGERTVLRTGNSLLLVLVLLAGCQQEHPDSSGKASPAALQGESRIAGTITVVTNRTDLIDTVYMDYAKRFHEKYPDAEVQFEALRDYDKNIKIRIASGETPDVLYIPFIPNSDLPKYFAPLDDLGMKGNLYFEGNKSANGKRYGIATGVSVTGIVYNKRAFAAAGVKEIPRTLKQFYEDCSKLKAAGVVPFASNFNDRWPLQAWVNDVPLLLSNNTGLRNDWVGTDTPFSGAFAESLGILKEMNNRGFLEPQLTSTNWEQSKRDLASGRTAMTLTGNWLVPQLINNGAVSEDIGFFPFPADNSGEPKATIYPDWYYAVGKNSKNLATAKAFVSWMLQESGYDELSGYVPVLKDREPKLPQLKEMNSYGTKYMEASGGDSDRMIEIQNKAQIELTSLVQEVILGDEAAVLQAYNRTWAAARKAILEGK